ncbi:hypothetical protein CPB83DRAFT_849085 [Crepidotus variabilis]|uniref:Uncharacterized protein n=1 Tax=Crepidotus variabilis TaxID=179855 RepID=A0A9P6EKJ5_9AGAR|nr:hypothetical protein CPB83DRAFT_849085 [Crepidotus variabilis]
MLAFRVYSSVLIFSIISACSLAQEVLTSLPYNFTFSALNTTQPNANTTGVPLVLGQAGATGGYALHVSSTYSSYPYNDYDALGLQNKILLAYGTDGSYQTNAVAVQNGSPLIWVTTTLPNRPADPIFSGLKLSPTSEYPLLAANGVSSLWSLCTTKSPRPQTNILFNVSTPNSLDTTYDPASCYGVQILILPHSQS